MPSDTDVSRREPGDSANPHDEFFKQTFQSVEHATALLRSGLPVAVRDRIDWDTLEQVPTEHIDDWFSKRVGDVLFRAQLRSHAGPVYLDILLEHQSSSQRMMVLRILGMMVRRYESLLREDPNLDRLPIVLPVVLYQGDAAARPWQHARRLHEVLAADTDTLAAFAPFIPDFEFALDDLTQQSIDHLHQRALTSLGYATIRLLRDARTIPSLQQLLDSPRELAIWQTIAAGPNGHLDLVRYLLYIYHTSDASSQDIHAFARKLGPLGEHTAMTAAERLIAAAAPSLRNEGRAEGRNEGRAEGRNEGRAEGRAEGRNEGRAEGRAEGHAEGAAKLLRQLLTLKFGELDPATHNRIADASLDDLEGWCSRVLDATRLHDVFASSP